MNEVTYEVALKKLQKRYYAIYIRATKKGYDFDLELYDLHLIYSSPCTYCGSSQSGIDRKDNDKGYTKENSVSCCNRCNSIKGSQLDYIEMKELGYELAISDADEDWF